MNSWLEILAAGMTGGFIVKVLDLLYLELTKLKERKRGANAIVNKHLDPLIKSADELLAKIISSARSDFKELPRIQKKENPHERFNEYMHLLYLFANFWARIEILRQESVYINIAEQNNGKNMIRFFTALESKKNRIIERSVQRGIAEALIIRNSNKLETITFHDFYEMYFSAKSTLRNWLDPLEKEIQRTYQKKTRQIVLKYGIILHCLIDTLDSEHRIVRERDVYVNKLSKKTIQDLKYRIFKEYLPFIRNEEKYYNVVRKVKKKIRRKHKEVVG